MVISMPGGPPCDVLFKPEHGTAARGRITLPQSAASMLFRTPLPVSAGAARHPHLAVLDPARSGIEHDHAWRNVSKHVNQAIKQEDREFSACTVTLHGQAENALSLAGRACACKNTSMPGRT
jgi:hypothetical protein